MRRILRVTFAAPLVMVTASGAPRAAFAEPPVPVVEGGGAPAGATRSPRAPGSGRARVRLPERLERPEGYRSCHDFGPGSRGCNPPRARRMSDGIDLAVGVRGERWTPLAPPPSEVREPAPRKRRADRRRAR